MTNHVCPWWCGYFIDNRFRRLLHDPEKILGPYVQQGMTVIDVGCGMGFFSIPMARSVGEQGHVVAVDLQQKMLDTLQQRAVRAGVNDRIECHRCKANRLGLELQADFALAFAMVHEVPDQQRLLKEIYECLKPNGRFLMAEPRLHVSKKAFERTLVFAEEEGLVPMEEPTVKWCQAMIFCKTQGAGQPKMG